jgi:hypothetical protein
VPPRRGELYTSVTLGEFGFDGAALIHGLGRRRAQTADTVPKRSRADCAPSAPPLNVRGALYPTEPLSARGGGASPDRTDRAIRYQRTAHRITSAVKCRPLKFRPCAHDTRAAIRLVETTRLPNPDPPHKSATDPSGKPLRSDRASWFLPRNRMSCPISMQEEHVSRLI